MDIAARHAGPALQFAHSLMRQPGGGKGRKERMAEQAAPRKLPEAATQREGPGSTDTDGSEPAVAAPATAPAAVPAQAQSTAGNGAAAADAASAQTAPQPAAGTAAPGPTADDAAAAHLQQPFRQLTRLTFLAVEAGQAQLLAQRSDVTSSYDIVAVQPLSERVMQQVRRAIARHACCLCGWYQV